MELSIEENTSSSKLLDRISGEILPSVTVENNVDEGNQSVESSYGESICAQTNGLNIGLTNSCIKSTNERNE